MNRRLRLKLGLQLSDAQGVTIWLVINKSLAHTAVVGTLLNLAPVPKGINVTAARIQIALQSPLCKDIPESVVSLWIEPLSGVNSAISAIASYMLS